MRLEVTNDPTNPHKIPWGEMTDAEKGALLLAHHEGKVIEEMAIKKTYQLDVSGVWLNWTGPVKWDDHSAYRIKPEPKRETVTMYGSSRKGMNGTWGMSTVDMQPCDTNRITFTTKDGEPDCDSIKMERIDE